MTDRTLEAADLAPSIDQIDTALEILRRREHPLATGLIVRGHRATYNPETLVYTLLVHVIENVNELHQTYATRCYRIAADGTIAAVAVLR